MVLKVQLGGLQPLALLPSMFIQHLLLEEQNVFGLIWYQWSVFSSS